MMRAAQGWWETARMAVLSALPPNYLFHGDSTPARIICACSRRNGKEISRKIIARWLLLMGGALSGIGVSADNRYVYDSVGRLVQVVAADGSSARYVYDAAGNITAIQHIAPAVLSVTSVSPTTAVIGTHVTLQGSGFDVVPAQNTVTLNGVAATVVSASPHELVFAVAGNASSGSITVSNSAGSATAAQTLAVVSPVAITGFTPSAGVAGSTLTIMGSGFDPVAANNRVVINNATAKVVAASATQLQVTVPARAASGPVLVATSNGSATSATAFIVPPGGIAAPDITSNITVTTGGGGQTVTLTGGNDASLLLIEGGHTEVLHLQLGNFTSVSDVGYALYGPDNVLVAAGTLSPSQSSLALPLLIKTGTYTLVLTSVTAGTLSAALQSAPAWPAGSPSLVATVPAGGSAAYTFMGTRGENLGFAITGLNLTPGTESWVRYDLIAPDGNIWSSSFCYSNGRSCASNLSSLPQTGTYTVVLRPANGAAASATLWLSADLTGSVTIGGSYPLALTTPGRNARLAFGGTIGQSLTLDVGNVVGTPAAPVEITLLGPDGAPQFHQLVEAGSMSVALPPLPATGTYNLLVEPSDKGFADNKRSLAIRVSGAYATLLFNAGSSGAATVSMDLLLH